MPSIGRRAALALCAVAFLAAAAVGHLRRGGGEAAPASAATSTGTDTVAATDTALAADVRVAVHVVGAVRHPGVYHLPAGSRTLDAVRRAGGATARADLAGVNLAAVLADGEQVRVPIRGAPEPAGASSSSAAPGPPAIVHLNSADAAALDGLPGVGPALAARIVAWRTEHGGFGSVDDLLDVPGIGPAKLDAMRAVVAP